MFPKSIYLSLVLWLPTVFLLLVSSIAALHYPGNLALYSVFCLSFLPMWYISAVNKSSYFLLYISAFMILGFWLILSSHLIFDYIFIEPIGFFDSSPESWDLVLSIVVCSNLAIAFAAMVTKAIAKYTNKKVDLANNKVPVWYQQHHRASWAISVCITLFIVVFNSSLGIFKVGLVPEYILPFKLNAIVTWLLIAGIFIWFILMLWWDLCLKQNINFKYIILCTLSTVISISILSRGIVVFQLFSLFICLLYLRKQLQYSISKLLAYFAVVILAVFVCVAGTMQLRDSAYQIRDSVYQNETKFKTLLTLSIDRWVGLEGVMAVSSWPQLGMPLLKEAITEKLSATEFPIYSTISNSGYLKQKNANPEEHRNHIFRTLPGVVAMLYYSGSLTLMFAALAAIVIAIGACESILYKLFRSPLLTSFYGMYMAYSLAQLDNFYLFALHMVQMFLFCGGIAVASLILSAFLAIMERLKVSIYANRPKHFY